MKHSFTDNSLYMCMCALYNNMHRELHTAYAKPPEELAIFQNFWSFICIISCFRLICLHQCNILICMYIMWQYNVIRKLNEHFQLYGTHPHVDKCTGNSRTIHRWISWSQNDSELLNKQSKLSQHWIKACSQSTFDAHSMRIQALALLCALALMRIPIHIRETNSGGGFDAHSPCRSGLHVITW